MAESRKTTAGVASENQAATGVEEKLDTVIRLLALSIAPDDLTLKERAGRLQRAGLAPKAIASLCETTPHTVSVALSKRKSKTKRKTAK